MSIRTAGLLTSSSSLIRAPSGTSTLLLSISVAPLGNSGSFAAAKDGTAVAAAPQRRRWSRSRRVMRSSVIKTASQVRLVYPMLRTPQRSRKHDRAALKIGPFQVA